MWPSATKYIEINRNMQPTVAKYVAFGHEIYGNRLKYIEICRNIPREIDRDLIEIENWKLEIFKVLHPLGGQK